MAAAVQWQQELDKLQLLPHGARVKRCLELGQESLNNPALDQVLEEACQAGHDFFAAQMSIYACYGMQRDARAVDRCKRALMGSSKRLRGLAQAVLMDIAPQAEIPQILLQLCGLASTPESPGKLLHVMHRLHKANKKTATALIVHELALKADPSALVATPGVEVSGRLQEYGHLAGVPTLTSIAVDDADANVRLLLEQVVPFGTERQAALLVPLLDALSHKGSYKSDLPWPLLIQRHSRVVVEVFATQQKEDLRWLLQKDGVMDALLNACPAQAKSLFLSLGQLRKKMFVIVSKLYKRFPGEMLGDLMSMHVDEDTDAQDLQRYYSKAQAARAQRTASHTAGGQPGQDEAPTTASVGMDVESSWIAPSSVGELVSVDMEMEDVTGGAVSEAAGGGAPVDITGADSPLYGLLKRTPLMDTSAAGYFNLRGHKVEKFSNDTDLLQVCLSGLQPTSHVLRQLPVHRRVALFNTWKAWWGKQEAQLQSLKQQVDDWTAGSHATVKHMRKQLEKHGLCTMWADQYTDGTHPCGPKNNKEPNAQLRFCRYMPVQCLLELVELLAGYTKPGAPRDFLLTLLSSPYIPPDTVANLLIKTPELWAVSTIGELLPKSAREPLFARLSAAQQEAVLLSHPCIQSLTNTAAALTESPAVEPVAELLLGGIATHWKRAVKLVYGEEGYDPAAPCSTDSMHDRLKLQLLISYLGALPDAKAVQQLFLRLSWQWHREDMVAQEMMAGLALRPVAMEDVFKRWLVNSQDRLSSPTSVFSQAHTRLMQSTAMPQHYQVLKVAVELRELEVAYQTWFYPITGNLKATSAMTACAKQRDLTLSNGSAIAQLLPASCRFELTRLAAREALAHDPLVLRHLSAQAVGPGKVLQLFAQATNWWTREWTTQQCEALLAEAPDLWKVTKHVSFLERLSPAKRLELFKAWAAKRQGVESQLATLLSATLELPGRQSADGGQVQQAMTSLVPAAAVSATTSSQPLLVKDDPVLALPGSELLHLLKQDAAVDPQLSQQFWEVVRHVVMSEQPWLLWSDLAPLLPPDVRSNLARARILRVMETKHMDAERLFRAIKDDLPYLSFKEIVEHKGFKEVMQSRELSDRQEAMTYLVSCLDHNIALLPQVLNWLHVRRREQDELRQAVLSRLATFIEPLAAHLDSQQVVAKAELMADAIAAARKTVPYDAGMPELRGIEAAAAKQACQKWKADGHVKPTLAKQCKVLIDNLPGLTQLVRDALTARDLSSRSIAALIQIIMSLFNAAPDWAISQWCAVLAYDGLSSESNRRLAEWMQAGYEACYKMFQVVKDAMDVAREEAVAGKPTPPSAFQHDSDDDSDQEEAAQERLFSRRGRDSARRKRLRASKAKGAKAAQTLSRAERKVPKFKGWCSNLLLEGFLLHLVDNVLPPALAVLQGRQGGLVSCLAILQDLVSSVVKQSQSPVQHVDLKPRLELALTKVVESLLPQVAALPDIKTWASNIGLSTRAKFIGWYADRILDWAPDKYLQLKHLVLPKTHELGKEMQQDVCRSLTNTMPYTRFDLLLPFMLENQHMPTAALKAVQMMFDLHPDQVTSTVPRLLAADPTYILVPPVFWFVMRLRQELLPSLADPLPELAEQGIHADGLFSSGVTTNQLAMIAGPGNQERLGKPKMVNLAGWHNKSLHVSLWLAFPEVTSTVTAKLSAAKQIMIGTELVTALKTQGTLDIRIVRNIMHRLAALPALPASFFLELLQAASAPEGEASEGEGRMQIDGKAAGGGGGGKEGGGTLSGEAVQDILLGALVRLDNFSQAWDALLDALKRGESSTALTAIVGMLTEEIKALQVEASQPTAAGAAGGGGGGGGQADTGTKVATVLAKIHQLPWQRPAVMRQVIKLLGMLASRSKVALTELMAIATYAAAGMQGGSQAVDVTLPLPPGKPLHRSAHLQLLTTLQDHYHEEQVRAVFQLSATSPDKEIAASSAVVPSFDLQRRAPASVQDCITLFLTLLDHPEQEVRQKAMSVWSDAAQPVGFQDGVRVIDKLMEIIIRITDEQPTWYHDRVAMAKGKEEKEAAQKCCNQWMKTVLNSL